MKLTREELLKQHESLTRHLRWIEEKLRQVDLEGTPATSGAPAEASTPAKRADPAAAPVGSTAGGGPEARFSDPESAPARPSGITAMTKAGCILLCVIASLLFLAGIFLLPQLIYG